MPIHDYECEKCHKVEEKFVSFADAELPKPCDCEEGALMQRVHGVHRPGHKFNGMWWKTARRY